MSDLRERLRALVILDEVGSDNPLGRDAADEIDKLEAQLARARAVLLRVVEIPYFKNQRIEAIVRDARTALSDEADR